MTDLISALVAEEARRAEELRLWKEGKLYCLISEVGYLLRFDDGRELRMEAKINREGSSTRIQPADSTLRLVDVVAGGRVVVDGVSCTARHAVLEQSFLRKVGRKRGFIATYDWYHQRGENSHQ